MTYLDPIRQSLINQLPDLHPELLDLYTLLAVVRGKQVTGEDVHVAWMLWTRSRRPEHPHLKDYKDLDPDVRERDEIYVRAIQAAVR